jgi:hypothetical protein
MNIQSLLYPNKEMPYAAGGGINPAALPVSQDVNKPSYDPRYDETEYKERSGKHKGVAGVARDVLGFLGDFLLTRLRMPAMYAPAQEQRKRNAAMEGFEINPEAGIERVRDIDAKYGQELYDKRQLDISRDATQARLEQSQRLNEEEIRLRNEAAKREATKKVWGSVAGSMNFSKGDFDPVTKQPRQWSKIRDYGNRYLSKIGVPEEELIPEKYDEDYVKLIRNSNTTVDQQEDNARQEDYYNDMLTERRTSRQADDTRGDASLEERKRAARERERLARERRRDSKRKADADRVARREGRSEPRTPTRTSITTGTDGKKKKTVTTSITGPTLGGRPVIFTD